MLLNGLCRNRINHYSKCEIFSGRNILKKVLSSIFAIITLLCIPLFNSCGPMIRTIDQVNGGTVYEVERYFDEFQKNLEQYPGITGEESQELYYKRYEYANERFREHSKMEGSQTDRGRAYIIYGPPDEISMDPMFHENYGENRYSMGKIDAKGQSRIKSLEVWKYYRPASNRISRSFGFRFHSMTFVFADLQGIGSYTLLFSTEDELSDSRINHY
jgi:GWxTD domain-containing protein